MFQNISRYIESLPDGWTIYVWLVAAAAILIAAAYYFRWAQKNDQFDEDIKYVVFDKDDKDRMRPEEYAKAQEVMAHQVKLREETLVRQASEVSARAVKHAKR